MLIERPADVSEVIHTVRIDRLPLGTELRVPAGQCAIFVHGSELLGLLSDGAHRLTPDAIPFLASPRFAADALEGSIFFVPVEPISGVVVRAQLGRVAGGQRSTLELETRAILTLQIDDPFRAAAAMLSAGSESFEALVTRALAPRLADLVSNMAGSGEAPIGTVGGAALGALKEALEAGELALDAIGAQVIDIASLQIRPVMERALAPRDPLHAAPKAIDAVDRISWGLEGLTFFDAPSGQHVTVAVEGRFGDGPIPAHLHDWVRQVIAEALHRSATSYSGSVRELPSRAEEWSLWLTELVAPAVEEHTGVRGAVTIGRVALSEG